MATQDMNANMHIMDENGNVNNIYPATKIANVDGLTAALNAKADTTTVNNQLTGKVDKENGKGLSTNDYTTAEKNKLAGIATGATAVTVDSTLSGSSTNAIQNQAVKTALDTKANASDVTTALASKADASTVSSLSSQVGTNTTDIATQTARIDEIASLPSGSTSGDAELMDIRVKADGTSATSAGAAVRDQAEEITDLLKYRPNDLTISVGNELNNAKFYPNVYHNIGSGLVPSQVYSVFKMKMYSGTTYYFNDPRVRFINSDTTVYINDNYDSSTGWTCPATQNYYITLFNAARKWICSTSNSFDRIEDVRTLVNTITSAKITHDYLEDTLSQNLLETLSLEDGFLNDQGNVSSSSSYKATDFIRVNPGDKVWIKRARNMCYYFIDKGFISKVDYSSAPAGIYETITVPTQIGAVVPYYIRVSLYKEDIENNNAVIIKGDKKYSDSFDAVVSEIANREINDKCAYFLKNTNLASMCDRVDGKYYQTAPQDSANYSYFVVPVKANTTYYANFNMRFVTVTIGFKSNITVSQNLSSFTPVIDGYAYISVLKNIADKFKLSTSNDFTAVSDLNSFEISGLKNTVVKTANLFDKGLSQDGYLRSNGGIESTTTLRTSGYMLLRGNVEYHFSRVRKVLYYEVADKSVLSSRFVDEDITDYTVTLNEDKYCRFSYYTSDENNTMVNEGAALKKYEPYGYYLADDVFVKDGMASDSLNGKKWTVCGDSFSYGGYSPMNTFDDGKYAGARKVYPYYIGNRTGIDIVDFTMGGRTLAYPSDGTFTNSLTCPSASCYYQNIPADTDYITIYLGINDSHHENGTPGPDGEDVTGVIPLGTITDNTTATYYGAWNVVLTWLMEHRPFAHIGIIVSNGCDRDAYRAAQIEIARKYGIPFIDLNGDDRTPVMIRSTNPNIAQTVKDIVKNKQAVNVSTNLHPNDAAHEYESTFIEDFLRSL